MRIIVCVKQVPVGEAELKVTEGQEVTYEGQPTTINECDEYALEEALALKEKLGGEVTVVTVGPLRSQEVLYFSLAKGADRAIRVDTTLHDSENIAKVLVEVIKGLDFDLILTGVESADNMSAQVGVSIAEMLGLPFALTVAEVNVQEDSKTIEVIKEFEGGAKEVLKMPFPAVLGIQPGIKPLTYVSHLKRRQARTRGIKSITLSDLGMEESELKRAERAKLIEIFVPERVTKVKLIGGAPEEAARALIQEIRGML